MRRARTSILLAALAAAGAGAAAAQDEADAEGIRLGAVLVRPVATVTTVYDDNIFRSARNRKASSILRAAGALSAETDWRRHALTLDAGAEAGVFARSPADDYLDARAEATAELDATRAFRARLTAGLARAHEARGGDDAPAALAGPIRLWRGHAEMAAQYAPGRLRAQPFVRAERLDYADRRLAAGGVADQDDRDRLGLGAGAKIVYAAPGAVSYFAEGEIRRIDYDRRRDRNGRDRDSTGFRAFAGIVLDPRGPLSGAVAVGWERRRFDDPGFRDVAGPAAEARIDWRPSRLFTLKLKARRGLEETTIAGAGAVRAASLEVAASYEVARFVDLNAEAGYERRSFRGAGRRDETLALGVGLRWRLRRDATLRVGARRVEEWSTAPGEGSRAHVVWVSAEYRF